VSSDAPAREIVPAGRIGLGTRRASAEFKDVRVTSGAATLLSPGFGTGADGWSGGEAWSVVAGAYRQPDATASGAVRAGQVDWRDYTLTLKARKLDGEGALVVTVYDDGAGTRADWVLGGQGNTKHAIVTQYAQQSQLVAQTAGSIDKGRWYDVKIAIRGRRMECFLDGRLVQSVEVLPRRVLRVYASAARDEKTGDIVLKVVNPGEEATDVAVELGGMARVADTARAIVLTGERNDVVNSFDRPASVAPVAETIPGIGPSFRRRLAPRSLTVLRIGGDAPSGATTP
jgi:alpha-L-arabinofuranosidase